MRTCTKCRTARDSTEFYQKSDGRLSTQCKPCTRAATIARTVRPTVDGKCACGRELRKSRSGSHPARACVVCRGLAEPCACGGMRTKGAARCRGCLRSGAKKLGARVCPSCGGPKSYQSTNCLRCTRAASPGTSLRGGYRKVRVPDGRWRSEHVVVMEGLLGRSLLPGETVHHKNGVKSDNAPGNLELWVVSQPRGQRPADLVAWAHTILERYESVLVE